MSFMRHTAVSRSKTSARHERSFTGTPGGSAVGRGGARVCVVAPPHNRSDLVPVRDFELPPSAVAMQRPDVTGGAGGGAGATKGGRSSSVGRNRSRSNGRATSRSRSQSRSRSSLGHRPSASFTQQHQPPAPPPPQQQQNAYERARQVSPPRQDQFMRRRPEDCDQVQRHGFQPLQPPDGVAHRSGGISPPRTRRSPPRKRRSSPRKRRSSPRSQPRHQPNYPISAAAQPHGVFQHEPYQGRPTSQAPPHASATAAATSSIGYPPRQYQLPPADLSAGGGGYSGPHGYEGVHGGLQPDARWRAVDAVGGVHHGNGHTAAAAPPQMQPQPQHQRGARYDDAAAAFFHPSAAAAMTTTAVDFPPTRRTTPPPAAAHLGGRSHAYQAAGGQPVSLEEPLLSTSTQVHVMGGAGFDSSAAPGAASSTGRSAAEAASLAQPGLPVAAGGPPPTLSGAASTLDEVLRRVKVVLGKVAQHYPQTIVDRAPSEAEAEAAAAAEIAAPPPPEAQPEAQEGTTAAALLPEPAGGGHGGGEEPVLSDLDALERRLGAAQARQIEAQEKQRRWRSLFMAADPGGSGRARRADLVDALRQRRAEVCSRFREELGHKLGHPGGGGSVDEEAWVSGERGFEALVALVAGTETEGELTPELLPIEEFVAQTRVVAGYLSGAATATTASAEVRSPAPSPRVDMPKVLEDFGATGHLVDDGWQHATPTAQPPTVPAPPHSPEPVLHAPDRGPAEQESFAPAWGDIGLSAVGPAASPTTAAAGWQGDSTVNTTAIGADWQDVWRTSRPAVSAQHNEEAEATVPAPQKDSLAGGPGPAAQLARRLPDSHARDGLFTQFDYSANGYLSLAQIEKAVVELLPTSDYDQSVLVRAFRAADRSGNGHIGRSAFRFLLKCVTFLLRVFRDCCSRVRLTVTGSSLLTA
jgi:hypothetical protein